MIQGVLILLLTQLEDLTPEQSDFPIWLQEKILTAEHKLSDALATYDVARYSDALSARCLMAIDTAENVLSMVTAYRCGMRRSQR